MTHSARHPLVFSMRERVYLIKNLINKTINHIPPVAMVNKRCRISFIMYITSYFLEDKTFGYRQAKPYLNNLVA